MKLLAKFLLYTGAFFLLLLGWLHSPLTGAIMTFSSGLILTIISHMEDIV